MLRKILMYGVIAGLIVGTALSATVIGMKDQSPSTGMLIGYLIMLVGLSLVFVAIKRHRDAGLGGVIRFWPAFGMGVGISFVASLCYVGAWEAAQAMANLDFANTYASAVIERQKAEGLSGKALAKLVTDMERFKVNYAKPSYRLPMTFAEIFPVGVLVSLISAAVLRNSRVLPAPR